MRMLASISVPTATIQQSKLRTPMGPQHGFVLRVALHDLRHIIRDALHALDVLVDGKNLLTKLGQLLRNGGTESAHADHQKGFHICLSFG